MQYSCLLTTTFFSILTVTHCQQIKPNFRILAPQVLCRDNKGAGEDAQRQITISMQTDGGQKLTYRVRMYFEVLGGYRGQQHALSLWRAVRTMEKKINIKDRDTIADKNQINVNNTELVQGVYYIFTITGIDDKGMESEAKNFTVAYSDGTIKRTNPDGSVIPDDITFLMIGSETAYANLEYKIEANVKFCTPRYDYYFKWEVSGLPEEYKNIVQIPGNTLRIPVGAMEGGGTYAITAKLLQSNDSRILLYDTINVTVKSRGILAKLFPENISIGVSRPVDLRILYSDYDNSRKTPDIGWTCKSSDGRDCGKIEQISDYQQYVEMYERGMYSVNVNVQQINKSKTQVAVTSIISVDPDVIVVPDFKNPPLHDIPPGERFQMDSTLDGLIPNCVASWGVVQESGYDYFDASLVPGGFGNISIADIDGNFLSELVDFVNSTVSRDISLIVPGKGSFPNWDGLKPNAKYKFRLTIVCPAPIHESQNRSQPETNSGRMVTSYADLTVTTQEPPGGKPLDVTPTTGVGLSTQFRFSTGVAQANSDKYPLKYNFQIIFDGIRISIGEFYENMFTTTPLPFSESNITTMYEVCDSKEACSIVNGPTISTTMPSDKDIDLVTIMGNLKATMTRMEYDHAFGFALICGTTLKKHPFFEKFKESFTKIVTNEINRLLERPTKSYYVSPSEIVKFVKYSRTSLQIINEDDNTNRGLLELLEAAENTDNGNTMPIRELIRSLRKKRATEDVRSIRHKRVTKDIDHKIDKINLELHTLESLIHSKNETASIEAMKLLAGKVQTFVTRLCNSSYFTYANFTDTSIVNMVVRASSINQILRTNLTIPYEPNERPSYIQINENLNVNPKHQFCVGKIMFPSDYLTGERNTDEIYNLIVAEKNNVNINIVDISDDSGERSISLSIPIGKESGNFECQIWENGAWSSNICVTSSISNGYVYCNCKKINIFRAAEMSNIEMNSTVTTASTAPTIISTEVANANLSTTAELVTTAVSVTVTNVTNAVTTLMEPTQNGSVAQPIAATTVMSVAYSDQLPIANATILSNEVNNSSLTNALTTASPPIFDIVTLTHGNSTLSSASTTLSPGVNITDVVKSIPNAIITPPETTPSSSESVLSTLVSTANSMSTVKLTSSDKATYSSSTGYTLAVIFVIAGIFIIVGLFVYNRRKKPNTLVQQLEIISSEIRTSNNAVKYARFHDEDTMRGDNIETIFTAQ